MNLDDILNNDTVKDLLAKAGVDDKQAKSITSQAMKTVKDKFDKDPKQMSSLLSENENTEDDNKLAASAEDDFLGNITSKLPDGIGDKLKGLMPAVIAQFTGKASDETGIAGMLGGITDLFDGDDEDDKKDGKAKASGGGGFMGIIKNLFGK